MHPSQPHNTHHHAIALVGAGRVGGSLRLAFADAGLDVRLAGRDGIDAALAGADVALLCVPDAAIATACASICARRESTATSLRSVGHTSGASSLEVLGSARDAGLGRFSIHPLQTIPTTRSALAGSPAAVAGDSGETLATANALANAAGLEPFEVPEHGRAAYHAAAAIASNFLIALEESAAELLEAAGVTEPARALLAPLALRSAANWAEEGGAALTGPIARGDEETVARHQEAIAELAPDLAELYEAMAARTRALAASPEPTPAATWERP